MNNYSEGDILIAKNDYLDLFKKGKEYKIISNEPNFGEDMYYVEDENGNKITGWGLKSFEISIQFEKK